MRPYAHRVLAALWLTVGVIGLQTACTSDKQVADGPGMVALRYTNNLFTGRYDKARKDHDPSERKVFDSFFAGVDGSSVKADIKVGKESQDADHATVVFIGKICPAKGNAACVTNSSTNDAKAPFISELVRRDGRWYVTSLASGR